MKKPEKSDSTLVIDTTSREVTSTALVLGEKIEKMVEPVRAQNLLEIISKLLHANHLKFKDIRAIAVLTGPGSFTGTRMGMTAANTLGWLYDIPLYGFSGTSFEQVLEEVALGKFPHSNQTIKAVA